MNVDHLILLAIKHAGGNIKGKTLLQKRIYFLSKLLNLDLGYRAHYYGPFSPEVDNGLGKLKALGFVAERSSGFGLYNKMGFELRRYDYYLTEDGQTVTESLKDCSPDKYKTINNILDQMRESGDTGDYLELSIAAKTYHILSARKTIMRPSDIRSAAKELGWDISEDFINMAAEFLEKSGLVQKQ
ncbi:MAG: hypothetical protein AB1641_23950 [Thermodesulfobacteriota bacterium]